LLKCLGKRALMKKHQYEIFIPKSEIEKAKKVFKKKKIYIGIHIGSGKTKNLSLRRWPLKYYSVLISKIGKIKNVEFLLFGGKEEESDYQKLASDFENVKIVKTKHILETAAMLKFCKIFLSVDTLLMHLAACVNVPKQLVIETPTFNETVAPYGRDYILIKNPLVHGRNLEFYRYDGKGIKASKKEIIKIMESVKPEDVAKELTKVIKSLEKER